MFGNVLLFRKKRSADKLFLHIKIPFQIFFTYFRFNAVRGHCDFCRPKNCIEHNLPKILVTPVFVVMSAGEAKSPSAIFAFRCPHPMLRSAAFDRLAHGWVATVRAVVAGSRLFWTSIGQDRRHTFHSLTETHMVVPLVIDPKWVYTACDRVQGQRLEVRVPMRVHRPMRFEIAADPFEKGVAGGSFWYFHRIMRATK